jgi:hypothetical protein
MTNNKLSSTNLIDLLDIRPDIRLFEVSGIRPDIRPSNPISGQIPDLNIGRIIRPDYPAGYPANRISGASLVSNTLVTAMF